MPRRVARTVLRGPGRSDALRLPDNDALRARETARSEGMPFPKTGDLSKTLITEAKQTPERAWLGEVSAVVLHPSETWTPRTGTSSTD